MPEKIVGVSPLVISIGIQPKKWLRGFPLFLCIFLYFQLASLTLCSLLALHLKSWCCRFVFVVVRHLFSFIVRYVEACPCVSEHVLSTFLVENNNNITCLRIKILAFSAPVRTQTRKKLLFYSCNVFYVSIKYHFSETVNPSTFNIAEPIVYVLHAS